MSQLVLMIARVDDSDNLETLTELWRDSLPNVTPDAGEPQAYLDGLETTVMTVGWQAMRTLMIEQWRLTDQDLVARFRQQHAEDVVLGDGYDPLKVVSRLGVVHLPRQVCYRSSTGQHVLPGNAGLPAHDGQVTTRGVQEWACLLSQDLPFGTSQRLLGWLMRDPDAVSETQVRRWVVRHGAIIRQTEQAEIEALGERSDLSGLQAQLVPVGTPRHAAGWATELNQAVDQALAQPNPQPPPGVTNADWERVITARQADRDASAEQLRRLGPEVRPGEVIASMDDVEVRRPEKRSFLDLRTGYVRTESGYRYLSGPAEQVLAQVGLLLMLCGGVTAKVTLLGDGAHWIIEFFKAKLSSWANAELLLDWYHAQKKCYRFTCLICRGQKAKNELLSVILRHLWRGKVDEAIAVLKAYYPQAKNTPKLDELIGYLEKKRPYIPNYQARRKQQQYIGSGPGEKANDLIVARRQKNKGMHWREASSDALAALRTLVLNGGWDLYWQNHQVLPLAIPVQG